jgi:hypothetical protein
MRFVGDLLEGLPARTVQGVQVFKAENGDPYGHSGPLRQPCRVLDVHFGNVVANCDMVTKSPCNVEDNRDDAATLRHRACGGGPLSLRWCSRSWPADCERDLPEVSLVMICLPFLSDLEN